MEEGYYRPEIEEFNPGFEYEIASSKMIAPKKWLKLIYILNESWLNYEEDLQAVIDEGGIRVKYLDREDIESLGFELRSEGNNRMEFCSLGESNYYLTKIGLEVAISVRTEGMLDREINSIKIKNKSELKRILKMIGYEQR